MIEYEVSAQFRVWSEGSVIVEAATVDEALDKANEALGEELGATGIIITGIEEKAALEGPQIKKEK